MGCCFQHLLSVSVPGTMLYMLYTYCLIQSSWQPSEGRYFLYFPSSRWGCQGTRRLNTLFKRWGSCVEPHHITAWGSRTNQYYSSRLYEKLCCSFHHRFLAFILRFLNVAQKQDLIDVPGGPAGKPALPAQGHEFSCCRGRPCMLKSIKKQSQTNKNMTYLDAWFFFWCPLKFCTGLLVTPGPPWKADGAWSWSYTGSENLRHCNDSFWISHFWALETKRQCFH